MYAYAPFIISLRNCSMMTRSGRCILANVVQTWRAPVSAFVGARVNSLLLGWLSPVAHSPYCLVSALPNATEVRPVDRRLFATFLVTFAIFYSDTVWLCMMLLKQDIWYVLDVFVAGAPVGSRRLSLSASRRIGGRGFVFLIFM